MQAIFFLILTGALYLKPPPADTQSNPLIAYSRPPSVPFLFVPQEKGLIRWVPWGWKNLGYLNYNYENVPPCIWKQLNYERVLYLGQLNYNYENEPPCTKMQLNYESVYIWESHSQAGLDSLQCYIHFRYQLYWELFTLPSIKLDHHERCFVESGGLAMFAAGSSSAHCQGSLVKVKSVGQRIGKRMKVKVVK